MISKLVTNAQKIESIPENWSVVEIQNICKTGSGGTPSRNNLNYYKGNIPWVKTGELKDGYIYDTEEHISEEALNSSSTKLFPPNTLLFAMYGATIGKTAITKIPATTNQACCAFLPLNKESIDPYFLQQYFILVRPSIISKGEGAGQPNTSQDFLKSFSILYPPFKEQQKIASILSKVDEVIQKTHRIIQRTQILKKGLLQRLLSKGIGHTKFKKVKLLSLIIQIPEEWELRSLDEISSITRLAGYEYTEYWKPEIDGSVIALRGFNIQENKLDLNEVERISEKLSNQLIRSKLNKGDVVFPCVGSIGKAALITEDRKYHINQNIAKITPGQNLNPLFLTYFLLSELTRHQISSYNASTSQPNVLVGNLRKFLIPLPSLPEQDKINRIITPIYSLLEKERQHRVNVLKLKKGLMQQLLTGKLRVTV